MDNSKEKIQENKMGVMSINKLLVTMSLPLMLSMFIQAMYNVVDSIFVAKYAQEALTAVSLTFPIQSLMIALACGMGVGINSLLSRRLGEKKFDEANRTATNGIFLGIIVTLIFSIAGFLLSFVFFGFFTKDETTIKMGKIYMIICTLFSLGVFMQIIFERLLQSTGKTFYIMFSQGVGAITNIILDPIFIFGLFGCPQMGIAGAAFATVAGQWLAMLIGLIFNIKKNREINLSFRGFSPSGRILKEIGRIAVPSFIMQSLLSITTMFMNKILADDIAISVYGVYFKLQSFIFMPVFGLTNAMIPIVAYNYGARKKLRITKTIRLAVIITTVIMAVGTVLFNVYPQLLLELFSANDKMLMLGVPALKIISICFVVTGFSIIICSVFQALNEAFTSMVISILRQLFFVLPAAFLLKHFLGFPAVWFSIPIAEFIACFICIIKYKHLYDSKIKLL